jgi:hypothetical protein
MLAEIKELVSFLAGDPLTADQVITRLGTMIQDHGGNVSIKPRNPLFKEADVIREIDLKTLKPSNRPAHVSLTPVDPPALDSLTKAFGAYKLIPAEEKSLPQVIFYLDQPKRPYTVALIGELKGKRVVRIILRRDIRL